MTDEHPDAIAYRRTADAFRSGDLGVVRSLIAPEVVWHVPGDHPMAGTIEGREALLEWLRSLRGIGFWLVERDVFASDEHVCAVSTMGARRDDVDAQTRVVSIFRYRDGRQVERWLYPDDADAWNAIFTARPGDAGQPMRATLPLTGGCNCGAVRYEVTEPLVRASYCHCKRCQRRSGAAASAQAHPAPGAFRIVAGEDRLRMWQPPDGGEKWFCGDCGSAMFGRNPAHPESVGIRLGTFDDDPGIRPTVRQFVAYAAAWEPLPDDGLPRYPESRHAPGARPV